MDASVYDADYFLRGRASGKSLYEDYRWLPELTIPMAKAIVDRLGITRDETVLDFGCARGYLVKAMRSLRVMAFGVDASAWAIENCDPDVREWLRLAPWMHRVDWIIAKDVMEHVPQAADVAAEMLQKAQRGIFVVVPLSFVDGQPYVCDEFERDATHVHRLTLASWGRMFCAPGWEVTLSYEFPGVKDNYLDPTLNARHIPHWEVANGFITARRVKE